MYKKFDFGKELAVQVDRHYGVTSLANWAHRKYLDHANQIDKDTRAAIMKIIAMDEGDEFVLTKEELLNLASDLQKDA